MCLSWGVGWFRHRGWVGVGILVCWRCERFRYRGVWNSIGSGVNGGVWGGIVLLGWRCGERRGSVQFVLGGM